MDVSDAVKKVTRCRFPAGQHCLTNLLRHSVSQLESDTFPPRNQCLMTMDVLTMRSANVQSIMGREYLTFSDCSD